MITKQLDLGEGTHLLVPVCPGIFAESLQVDNDAVDSYFHPCDAAVHKCTHSYFAS